MQRGKTRTLGLMDTFSCPICRGRIALWAIRKDLKCPHCNWWLKSNIDSAMNRCFLVGLFIEGLLLGIFWFALENWFNALYLSLTASGILGFVAGVFAIKRMVVLKPFQRVAI